MMSKGESIDYQAPAARLTTIHRMGSLVLQALALLGSDSNALTSWGGWVEGLQRSAPIPPVKRRLAFGANFLTLAIGKAPSAK